MCSDAENCHTTSNLKKKKRHFSKPSFIHLKQGREKNMIGVLKHKHNEINYFKMDKQRVVSTSASSQQVAHDV